MLMLEDIRDYIVSLKITLDNNVYMGKLDAKKLYSIGVYNFKRNIPSKIALGGNKNSSYRVKPVSLLVHWNKSPRDTEKVAYKLYDMLQVTRDVIVNNEKIKFINMLVSEPQDVGTDDNGVYEYVIDLEFYYER